MTTAREGRRHRLSDTLVRQWRMLQMIPRAPRKIDAATLEARLREHGLAIDRRSIQRDLQKLSSVFPLVCDDRHKPYGWSWTRDAKLPFDRDDPRSG